MYLAFLSLLLVALTSAKPHKPDSQCLQKGRQLYKLMSTVTPYDEVHGKIDKFEDCSPEALWLFVRHGTRFPHVDELNRYFNLSYLRDEVVENSKKGKGELCSEDVEALTDWELVADPQLNMLLTSSGMDELRRFGNRVADHFPKLVKKNSNKDVEVRITTLERTRQSAESFMTAVFEKPMKIPNSMIYNELLKNENNCTAWRRSTKNDRLREETKKFRESPEIRQMLRDVSSRLGLDYRLEFDKVKDIYDVCTLEYSWYHNKRYAPWCAALSNEDLKLMEYNEDLTYFYKSAHGNNLTAKLGCALVKDITEKLTVGMPGATFYFGHSLGVRKLLTSLGIGADTFLSGDHYATSADRKWRTSYLTPFAANLMAVRYDCKRGSHGIWEKTRVAIFVNEKLKHLPACGNRSMCGLGEFKRAFQHLTDPGYCNRDFCEQENDPYDQI